MNRADYFGENELVNALAVISKHMALKPLADILGPFEVDASYQHEKFGNVPSTVSISKCQSKFHKSQCYQILLMIKLPKAKVDKILTVGEAVKIESWLEMLRDAGEARAILFSTYRSLRELEADPPLG